MEIYQNMVEQINEMNRLDCEAKKNGERCAEKGIKTPFLEKKKQYQKELDAEIKNHAGTPRLINVRMVLDHKSYVDGEPLAGITWRTLKASRRIAEFASEMSRAMGLKHLDITFDKIILKWENRNSRTTSEGKLEILRQIVLDGFDLPILHEDGTVEKRRFQFVTASAGQLRTNKIQCISVDMWHKIEKRLMCGMTYEKLNEQGGINVGKLLAYQSLSSSATDEWNFDLDHAIVVKDFEAPVVGVMDYINQEYVITRGEREVMINHCDGIGMALPGILPTPNAMARAPFIKGLLTTFDYLGFCAVNGCEPVLTDIYGVEHDLIKEDIQIIFTESQFKLHKYYKSWDEYKKCFVENGCHICLTNYEEEWIPDAAYNYQFMQALVNVTKEELNAFTGPEHDRIERLCEDQAAMLRTLNADAASENAYQRALCVYPELLWDGYSKETLKAIRKRRLLDAKSANFKCRNKRLFAIPDMYAACQFWFLHQERPEGLLKNGEVYAQLFWAAREADILRSPSLSFEHAVRKFNHDPIVASWFTTNGIYTSCHDLISRVLQFDVDGDQLNVVTEPAILSAAKRNREELDAVPIFYDANKAPPEIITRESLYLGLKRAHDYSGIGTVSNSLTKLWNKPNPDQDAAKMLCMYNNYVIDAAKTGFVNSYADHPESKKKVNKAIGGKTSSMPWFFQFTKNGRSAGKEKKAKKKAYLKPNDSTMNRLAKKFANIGQINLNLADVKPFNWMMLLSSRISSSEINFDAINTFCELDDSNFANIIEAKEVNDFDTQEQIKSYDILRDIIIEELTEKYGGLEQVYPSVVKYLFTDKNFSKQTHKQMFWRVFGEIAERNIQNNLKSCHVCNACGMKIPDWYPFHECSTQALGFVTCVDCGKVVPRVNSRQIRCPDCQKINKRELANERKRKQRQRAKVASA